jgi:uncharacterized protein (TIGR00369 family)
VFVCIAKRARRAKFKAAIRVGGLNVHACQAALDGINRMHSFQPKDPDYRQRVAASFERQQAMRTLGIAIQRLGPGEIELSMPFAAAYTQQHGFVHGGIITTALDSACGYAAFSLMPAEAEVLTVEFKTNLLAPAIGQHFAFRARVVKAGRSITVCEAQAFALDQSGEKLVATMTGTLMALFDREGRPTGGAR